MRPMSTGGIATKRALIVGLALLGMWLSLSTVARSIALRSPELATRIAPYESAAFSTWSTSDLFIVQPPNVARAQENARAALRLSVSNVAAVRNLGISFDMQGDSAQSRVLIELGQRLSRRDLGNQIYRAVLDAKSGDIESALDSIDLAIRTSPRAQSAAIPTLLGLLNNRDAVAVLVDRLSEKPNWGNEFIRSATGSSANLQNTTLLVDTLLSRGVAIDTHSASGLIYRLLDAGEPAKAFDLYRRVTGRSATATIGDLGRAGQIQPLDWQLSTAASQVEGPGNSPAILLAYDRNAALEPLLRIVALPPGRHTFRAEYSVLDGGEDSSLRFRLQCLGGARIADDRDRFATGGDRTFAASVSVPSGCQYQRLILQLASGEGFQQRPEILLRRVTFE